VTSQIFLGGEDFLSWIEQRLHGKHVANIPSAHLHPTRLSADDVLKHVAGAYRVQLGALLDRSHHDAYQTAVYLLRRAANEPLHTVAGRHRNSGTAYARVNSERAGVLGYIPGKQLSVYYIPQPALHIVHRFSRSFLSCRVPSPTDPNNLST